MRASEVMKILRISWQTLSNYTKKGFIRTTTLVNDRYDYNTDDVYKVLNNDVERKTCNRFLNTEVLKNRWTGLTIQKDRYTYQKAEP